MLDKHWDRENLLPETYVSFILEADFSAGSIYWA